MWVSFGIALLIILSLFLSMLSSPPDMREK